MLCVTVESNSHDFAALSAVESKKLVTALTTEWSPSAIGAALGGSYYFQDQNSPVIRIDRQAGLAWTGRRQLRLRCPFRQVTGLDALANYAPMYRAYKLRATPISVVPLIMARPSGKIVNK
jgi:hypothetical protein